MSRIPCPALGVVHNVTFCAFAQTTVLVGMPRHSHEAEIYTRAERTSEVMAYFIPSYTRSRSA